jgi:hypothetical protein
LLHLVRLFRSSELVRLGFKLIAHFCDFCIIELEISVAVFEIAETLEKCHGDVDKCPVSRTKTLQIKFMSTPGYWDVHCFPSF